MSGNMWIALVKSSHARIFEIPSLHMGRIKEVHDLIHPSTAPQDPDHPGWVPDYRGYGSYPMAQVHPSDAPIFAKEVVDYLEKERNRNAFSHLVIMASHPMLELMRNHYSEPLRKRLVLELDKNLTRQPTETMPV